MLKRTITVLLSLSLALPVQAAVYKWVDQRGTVYFADDLGKVPSAYRKKAQVVNGEGEQAVEVTETVDQGGKKPHKSITSPDDVQSGKSEKKKAVYAGKDEEWWRKEFGRLKDEQRATEEYLADVRKRKESTATLSRRDYLSLQQSEKDGASRLDGVRQKLQGLTESADKAGVPKELR
jgi:hypothetical protein